MSTGHHYESVSGRYAKEPAVSVVSSVEKSYRGPLSS